MPTSPPVRELTTLQLVHGTILLGILTLKDTDFPWVNCTFVPTPAFATVKPLFDAELTVPEAEWDQLYQQIIDLGLQLVNPERDQCIDMFLLHIEGNKASFRY